MMNMKKSTYIFVFCLAISSSFAQTTKKDSAMHQSMTIERDFSPIISDANKIDQQPEISELKVKKTAASYANWIAPNVKSSDIGKMPAGQVIAEEEKFRRGFSELSSGNYWNTDLKAGIFFNKDLSLDLNGFYTQGNLPIEEDPNIIYLKYLRDPNLEWNCRYLDGNAKFNYSHDFDYDSRISAHVGGGGRNYNLFALAGDKVTQSLWRIFGDVSYDINNLSLALSYQHSELGLGNPKENSLHLKVMYGWLDNEDWQLKLSLDLGYEFGIKNPFNFLPEIEYSKLIESRKRFYINAKAGVKSYGLYNIMSEMPLLIPSDEFGSETIAFDGTVGYEDNGNGNFKWGAFAEVAVYNDRHDVEMFSPEVNAGLDYEVIKGLTLFGAIQKNSCVEFKIGAYMNAYFSKYLGINADVNYNSKPRFGAPKFNFGVHFLSNPIKKLNIDLSFIGGINREMKLFYDSSYYVNPWLSARPLNENIEMDRIDVGNNFDLAVRIDYNLLDNLTIFANGSDLLNMTGDLFAGIPSQGRTIVGGVAWKF